MRCVAYLRCVCFSRKWIVNTRGYVNIIPSPGDVVYGFVFILSESDEKKMDNQEGEGYTKRYDLKLDLLTPRKVGSIKPLIYIDVNRKDESAPYEEMLVSWNSGIKDGLENGIPEDYFEKYLRRFVPPT